MNRETEKKVREERELQKGSNSGQNVLDKF